MRGERQPVPFGRYLRLAVLVAVALLVVGLLLVRLVMSWTGIGSKPILAGIVGFVLGRMSRR